MDAVAALRASRHGSDPDPVAAAVLAEVAGADGVTARIRAERRPVTERDVRALRLAVRRLTLEVAFEPTALDLAVDVAPQFACLVPARADETPIDRGLDCAIEPARLATAVRDLTGAGADVSILIDPDARQIRAALATGVGAVTLHAGRFALARDAAARDAAFADLVMAAAAARELGLRIHAAHGLGPRTLRDVASVRGVEDLHVGHALVARSLLVGIDRAVREMRHAVAAAAASSAAANGAHEEDP